MVALTVPSIAFSMGTTPRSASPSCTANSTSAMSGQRHQRAGGQVRLAEHGLFGERAGRTQEGDAAGGIVVGRGRRRRGDMGRGYRRPVGPPQWVRAWPRGAVAHPAGAPVSMGGNRRGRWPSATKSDAATVDHHGVSAMSTSERSTTSHLAPVWFQVTDLQVASGEGCWVTTVDGERYLDFTAGIAVVSTGHCHPRGRRGHRRAGRAVHPRPGQLLPPRPARAAGGAPGRGHPRRHRHVLLRQLRGRGHRGRGEAGQAGHRSPQRDRVPGQLPRPHAPGHGHDHVQDGLPGRPHAAAVRGVPGARSRTRSAPT